MLLNVLDSHKDFHLFKGFIYIVGISERLYSSYLRVLFPSFQEQ